MAVQALVHDAGLDVRRDLVGGRQLAAGAGRHHLLDGLDLRERRTHQLAQQ